MKQLVNELPEIIVPAGYSKLLEKDYVSNRALWKLLAALEKSLLKNTKTQTLQNGSTDNNCIVNATDNYGHPVTGNVTFARNPEKYGFKELSSIKEVLPGDLVQEWLYLYFGNSDDLSKHNSKLLINKKLLGILPLYRPSHAMIFDSYAKDGMPLFNYANGSGEYRNKAGFEFDPSLVGKDYAIPYDDFNDNLYKAYRYIGTNEELELWKKDLNQLIQNNKR